MKKRFTKIMAVLMATALIMSIAAISGISASAYTPVHGDNIKATFNKYLIVEEDASVPNMSFSYTIADGTAILASQNSVQVLSPTAAGVIGTPTIADVTFSPTDTPSTTVVTGDNVTLASGKKYVKKSTVVDFSQVTFPEPGIYRYIVTEQENNKPGVSYDTQRGTNATAKQRVLDVYVTDNNGALEVSQYVMHDQAGNVNVNANSGSADVTNAGDSLTDKSDGFVNEYKTHNLTIAKKVTGNQGSKDKYFKFTVTITNATAGDKYTVSYANDNNPNTTDGNANQTIAANPNNATTCISSAVSQPTTLTVAEGGTLTQEFYLHDGQSIVIRGLADGVKYDVAENAEDYTKTETIANDYADPVKNTTGITGDIKTGYTNTKDGIIPTGVLLTIAPFAIGILVFGAIIFFVISKRRRDNY